MEAFKYLIILVVAAPLLSALICGFSGRNFSRTKINFISCGLIGLAFIASTFLLYHTLVDNLPAADFNLYRWARAGGLSLNVGFLIDKLSLVMSSVVLFISLVVHIYSIDYMHDDPGYKRFFCYISLFTFAMLMLVLANNFMQLFFGWEGVGLVSYLLIGFWYTRPSANFASLKAFIINRIGDFAFIIGIAAVLYYANSLDYLTVFKSAAKIGSDAYASNLICLCLFIGAMAKSAQIPLHVWLPDSMEGPTPISALIHAATMVTAGVFMVARMAPLYEFSSLALNTITIIGAATCFFIGILAVVQTDIKRIIAYSTISQLGYMMVALGVSAYDIAIFHLVTHAFFKALLFLAAGSIILAMHHEQNIFKMRNLRKAMPITFVTMLIGTLAIIGFPGTSGFYSKDLIIEAARDSNLAMAGIAYYATLLGVFFTALYSLRLIFVVFYGNKFDAADHESARGIWIPLVVLAVPSLLAGALISQYLFPDKSMFWHGFVAWPFLMLVLGSLTAWFCYYKRPGIPVVLQLKYHSIAQLLQNNYGFDNFYQNYILLKVRGFAVFAAATIDKLWIDNSIVNKPARVIGQFATRLARLQSGYIYHYVFMMITGFFILLIWMFILPGV